MKITESFLLITFMLLSKSVFAENDIIQGEQLYKTYCSGCHGLSGGMDMRQRVAPPIAAVRFHYIDTYPDKTSFVTAITNWVEKQDENKSLMRGAIRRFNIMPPISISREYTQKIAGYIYAGNIEKPAGFDKHVEEMHGKR